MIQLAALSGPPTTAAEAFKLLQANRVLGLVRLDLPTVLVMPLYYLLFLGLFAGLRRSSHTLATLGAAAAFVGVTLLLATPTGLSMLSISGMCAAATMEEARDQLLAAGEAILATDMWHGTGAILGGLLLESGAVLICVAMLRSGAFGKSTAYVGLVTHGLDLPHGALRPFLPRTSFVLMAIAGPLYLVWFAQVARSLLLLGSGPPHHGVQSE